MYVPGLLYIWYGFISVDVFPSPKFHCQLLIFPEVLTDRSLKNVVSPRHIVSVKLKLAIGSVSTITTFVSYP